MNIYFGNQGQYGDIVINTYLAKVLKNIISKNDRLILNINRKYCDILPLLINNKYIDDFHIWDGYDNWPSVSDADFVKNNKDDIFLHPMSKHRIDNWYNFRHQCEEACYMFIDRYEMIKNKIINDKKCYLNINNFYFEKRRNYIAFAPFAGWYNKNNNKKLSIEFAQDIVNALLKNNFKVLQLGCHDEPKLDGAEKHNFSLYNSTVAMLSCSMLLHTDTFLGWAASAYEMPQLGLYSNLFYGENIVNIQPINKNSIFLDKSNVNNISVESIIENTKSLL
jgi:hypothetical protein